MAVDYPSRSRLPDWEKRLYNFLHDNRDALMVWGEFDCVLGLARGAVKAQTGEDLGEGHLGQYANERAAMRYLIANGWGRPDISEIERLAAFMDNFLRRERKGRRHRGNIVLLDSEGGAGFGVRVGSFAYVLHEGGGLHLVRIPKDVIEWKVT